MRLRLKVQQPVEADRSSVPFEEFLREYFNAFLSEFGTLLSDYRSVQEHANRNKIIASIEKFQKDLSLLHLLIKGLFVLKNINLKVFKKETLRNTISQLVSIAEFIAEMHNTMKTSFIPRPDVRLALQSLVYPQHLLISHNTSPIPLSSLSFDEINRLMKIYLLKEDLKDFVIEEGTLRIVSKFFTFHLILCGDFVSPEWKILKIEGNTGVITKSIENHLIFTLPPKIDVIEGFCAFYENRQMALDVFKALEGEVHGFFKRFSGRIGNERISGSLEEKNFVSTLSFQNQEHVLVNKPIEYIRDFISDSRQPEVEPGDIVCYRGIKNFLQSEHGTNYCHFVGDLYLIFFENKLECLIGSLVSVELHKRKLRIDVLKENRIVMISLNNAVENMEAKLGLLKKSFYTFIDAFVDASSSLIPIIYKLSCCVTDFILDNSCITTPLLKINSDYRIVTFSPDVSYPFDSAENDLISCESMQKFHSFLTLVRMQSSLSSIPYRVIESIPGRRLILKDSKDLTITLSLQSRYVQCSIEVLTEDCKRYKPCEALVFITSFRHFYTKGIFPVVISASTIALDFHLMGREFLRIKAISEKKFRLYGKKCVDFLGLSDIISLDDQYTLDILFKGFLMSLLSTLGASLGAIPGNDKKTLFLPNGDILMLTHEYVTFVSKNKQREKDVNLLIRSNRDPASKVRSYLINH